MLHDERKEHKTRLEKLLEAYDLQGQDSTIHLLKGDPGVVIPGLARKKRVELIVMGTIARTGVPGFFIGNTAEKTLGAVDCPVLTVKPATFTTPVEIWISSITNCAPITPTEYLHWYPVAVNHG